MKCRGCLALLLLCAAAGAQTFPATQPLTSIGDATLITLHLDNVTPKEAFDRLEQVSKLHVTIAQPDIFSRNDDQKISATFDKATYLSAVLELCRQTNLQVNSVGSRLMLLPSPGGRSIPPHVDAGPLEIFCNAITLQHEIQYGQQPQTTTSAVLNFSIISEARVPVISIDGPAMNVHAADEHGHAIPSLDLPRPIGVIPQYDVLNVSDNRFFTLQLAVDPAASNSIATVGGSVIARVISKSDVLTIKDLLASEGSSTTLGESVFTVSKVEQAGPPAQYQVDLDVKSPTLSPTFFTRLRFNDSQFIPRLDPAGNIVRVNNIIARADGITVSLIVVIPPRGGAEKKPLNLLWTLPSEIRKVEVPFEFHDLKLH